MSEVMRHAAVLSVTDPFCDRSVTGDPSGTPLAEAQTVDARARGATPKTVADGAVAALGEPLAAG